MKRYTNIDLYELEDKFLIADKDSLYLLVEGKITNLKLPLAIKNLQLSVGVANKIIVWGDDGIGNTFYIGQIDSGEWERIWLTDTNKKVASVVLDYKDNIFVVLKGQSGIVYEAIINKKRYIWTPPRRSPASIVLSDQSDTQHTVLEIKQQDNAPIQITKDLKQTCKLSFVMASEYLGIANDTLKFNHKIMSVDIESNNFEQVKLTPAQFKLLLAGDKSLQEMAEIKYKSVSYESFKVERDPNTVIDTTSMIEAMMED